MNNQQMNIYKCIDTNGRIEFRAGTRQNIELKHYDDEPKPNFVKVEIVQHNVSFNEVYNHKRLPILICQ
jgi:hypothetical protein